MGDEGAAATTGTKAWQAHAARSPVAVLADRADLHEVRTALVERGWLLSGIGNIVTVKQASQYHGLEGRFRSAEDGAREVASGGTHLLFLSREAPGAIEVVHPEWPILRGVRCFAPPPSDSVRAGGRFTFVELFAGIGGFRVALERLDGRCIVASEVDTDARSVYEANFAPHARLVGDVRGLCGSTCVAKDGPTLLVGGFPCQSFSIAGHQKGFGDGRGELFFELVRIVDTCRPQAFLLENVANLVTMDDGRVWRVISDALRECGYSVDHRVMDSSALVPQSRERVYIVGFRTDLPASRERFVWPDVGPDWVVPAPCVRDILEAEGSPSVLEARLTPHQWAKVQAHPSYAASERGRTVDLDGTARTVRGNYRTGYMVQSEFVPIAAGPDGVPRRFFTPREVARLQGFPAPFKIASRNPNRIYHQCGNAVTVPMVGAVAASVLEALEVDLPEGMRSPREAAAALARMSMDAVV